MNDSPNDRVTLKILKIIASLRSVPPRDPQAAARGREQFLAQARQMQPAVSPAPEKRPIGWFQTWKMAFAGKEKNPMFTTLSALLLAFVLLFSGSAATAYAAQDDLPGDTLYPVKTFTEEARLWLASDEQDIPLYEEFANRRVTEADALADSGRYEDIAAAMNRYQMQIEQATQAINRLAQQNPAQADALALQLRQTLMLQVQELDRVRARISDGQGDPLGETIRWAQPGEKVKFEGAVEAIGSETWQIAGRTVTIQGVTRIEDDIQVGDLARVEGVETPEGILLAHHIWLLDNGNENSNSNDNENGNGNDNGNENSNSNDNENGNENSNSNDNGNENGNSNDNGNENSNSNDNGNENSNSNDNGNENSNSNDNGNENSNDNGNENSNDNGNENSNDNENENGNGNENGNENSNSNDNENENGNGNGQPF